VLDSTQIWFNLIGNFSININDSAV